MKEKVEADEAGIQKWPFECRIVCATFLCCLKLLQKRKSLYTQVPHVPDATEGLSSGEVAAEPKNALSIQRAVANCGQTQTGQ